MSKMQEIIGGSIIFADFDGVVVRAPNGKLYIISAYCSCNSGGWWISILPADSPNLSYAEKSVVQKALQH
jgi:hypothetical protein